jgi:hypothetical protein
MFYKLHEDDVKVGFFIVLLILLFLALFCDIYLKVSFVQKHIEQIEAVPTPTPTVLYEEFYRL